MNISVRYMRDLKRTYWCTLYLRRKATMVLTSAGVLVLLAAFLPSRSSQAATVVLAAIGIILLVEVPLVIWLMVVRNWDALNEEVEVTVTSEEIVQRTATTSLRLSWDMVQRIISLKDMWLFYTSRLKLVTLYKVALTAAQQAELAAFIEARKRLLAGFPHLYFPPLEPAALAERGGREVALCGDFVLLPRFAMSQALAEAGAQVAVSSDSVAWGRLVPGPFGPQIG